MELGQVMRTFGWLPTEGELQDMIGVIDQDGNGCITFDEFVWLMQTEMHDADIEDEIREAFRVFDREGNGFIPVPELTEVLLKLGEKLSQAECEVTGKQFVKLILLFFILPIVLKSYAFGESLPLPIHS